MNKRLLIITTSFAPENEIGSVRMTKLTKYLVRLGYDITVVSPELHEISRIDNSLLSKEIRSIKKYNISQSSWFIKIFLKKRNTMLKKQSASNYIKPKQGGNNIQVLKAFIYSHLQFLYTIIRNLDWKRKVVGFIKDNFIESQFDIVLSSYPSLASHWSANWVRKNNIAKIWLADFRDPINYEINSSWLKLKINTYFQNKILNQADYATCVSVDLFKKFNSRYHYKLKYLPNGFDNEDLESDLCDSKSDKNKLKLTFCYVGSLYGGARNLCSFFKAINSMKTEDSFNIDTIKLIYAGKEFEELYRQASEFNLTSILENKGSVSRSESIKIQNCSDVIVVVTWNTEKDQGILTGKLFECFLTKTIVLGIVNGNVPKSEFKNIITRVNGGFSIEDSSLEYEKEFDDLKSFIYQKVIEKQKTRYVSSQYNANVEEFNYKNITLQLSSYFNKN